MENCNKPPLGIIPIHIWRAQRLQNIKEAMKRYTEANIQIPIVWVIEYNDLINKS